MVLIFDKFSNSLLPLTIIPSRLALPIPEKNTNGTEITKAHGQDVTKNTNDLYNHSLKFPPNITGITVNKIADITITGV